MAEITIVTGAAGNLGQAIVNKFLAAGSKVVGTITPRDAAIKLNDQQMYERVVVDLTNEQASQQFVDEVINKYGKIDTAVLTVGGFAMGKIADTSTVAIFKQYQLNFETAYNMARPVFVQMLQKGRGSIFLIGSRPGLDATMGKGMVAYSLVKSLIFRLAEIMNEEAKGTNVVTSVIVPSTIDTPQNRQSMPKANFENWVKPEEIADVVYFYSSQSTIVIREPVIKIYKNA